MPRDRSTRPRSLESTLPTGLPISDAQAENVTRALVTVQQCTAEILHMLRKRSAQATQVRLRHLLDTIAYAQEQLR